MAKRHSAGQDFQSKIARCQELIMAHSGVDEFYEVIRLIVTKYLRETQGFSDMPSKADANTLLKALNVETRRALGDQIDIQTPDAIYPDVQRIFSTIDVGGQDFHVLDGLFEILTSKNYKSDKGQYFTPRHVVDMCVEILAPRPEEFVCDPACGSGAFLRSAQTFQDTNFNKTGNFFGFDYSKRACQVATIVSFLSSKGKIRIEQVDSLQLRNNSLSAPEMHTIENLMKPDFDGFDVILTNPPFAGDVSGEQYAKGYELAGSSRKKIERDVLFLERCIQLLKPGGRMAIVVPDNKVSGRGFSYVRKWLFEHAQVVGVVSLHRYAFLPYTSQKASVLFIRKPLHSEQLVNESVLMFRSDLPGKTSNGSLILKKDANPDAPPYISLDHDLEEIVVELRGKLC